MVDVIGSHAAGDKSSHDATVPAQREETGQAAAISRREQARYEREVAALDLADAAQAMARSQPRQDVDRSADSSQADLATALYASADRHRRLAERLESGDGAPGVDGLRVAQGLRCAARYIPAGQLDDLAWADLCALLTDPAQVAWALDRAHGGAWFPQELQARQAAISQALNQLDRQQQRLLDAYLAEIIALPELQRKREDLDRRNAALAAQQRQLDAAASQRLELSAVADGIEAFCQAIRAGHTTATFEQRRQLAELLIDRVIVTGDQAEIRYVLPTTPAGRTALFASCVKTISTVLRSL